MRKVQFLAVFWTLVLAVPFTALALAGAAYLTDHLAQMANALTLVDPTLWRQLAQEASARSPEVAGMIIGLLVILLSLSRSQIGREPAG